MKYNKLTVIKRTKLKDGRKACVCRCDCGNERTVRLAYLESGRTKSCGCYGRSLIGKRSITHGNTVGGKETRTYKSYMDMKARCENPNTANYSDYGGRGISVCDKWSTFDGFFADMGECPAGLSIDRINNNKGYSPDNCRWATRLQQNNNTRANIFITHLGETHTLAQWSRITGISQGTLSWRNRKGWSSHDTLTQATGQ